MGKVYSIANQKGGVGKSATCLSLSAALAEEGKRILMIDLDPQSGLTVSLGFDPDSFNTTIYNSLINPEEVPLRNVITKSGVDGVDLVPSNLDLAGAEAELIGEIGWDRNLKEAIEGEVSNYDFLLLDCPPSLGVLTTNALMAAHYVIVPVQAEYLAMRGIKQLNRIIAKVKRKGNPDIQVKILRTMHNTRTLHSSEVVEEVKSIFKGNVYDSIIKRTIKFADATLAGKPILAYARDSEGANAYRSLAKEVLNNA